MLQKLGVATYVYLWQLSLETSIEHISKFNFRGIELMTSPPHAWPFDLSVEDRIRIKDIFESYNIDIVALNPTFGDINLASPRYTVRKHSIAELKEHIKLANELEAKIVVIIPGKGHLIGTPPIEKTWDYSKKAIIECAQFADNLGITIGLEHTPFLFIEKGDQLKKMIEEVGMESVKAVFDTSNTSVIEPVTSVIKTLKDLIIHVHLADNDCNKWNKLPISMGTIDFKEVFNSLKNIGFNGWSIIELWYPENPDKGILLSKDKLEALGWKI